MKIKRELLAFVHIEKSAGTSIIHLLRHNYFPRYLDVRPLGHNERVFKGEDFLRYTNIAPWVKVIGGHSVVPWSDLESVANVRYITLLRNPVNRYVSQYRYWSSQLGKAISIDEYLSRKEVCNIQLKKIAGEENVDKAIDIISEKFLCIGVVELFDWFLVELQASKASQGFRGLHIEQNINKKHPIPADHLIEKYADDMIENNRLDIELYNYVLKSIEGRISRYSEDEQNIPKMKWSLQLFADYLYRKTYIEPVTGRIRAKNGLGKEGSY